MNTEAPPVNNHGPEQTLPPLRGRCRTAIDICEEAGELNDERERQENADNGDLRVVDHAVREARRAERRRDRGEEDDRTPVSQSVVDEPV